MYNTRSACQEEALTFSKDLQLSWKVPVEGELIDTPVVQEDQVIVFTKDIQPGWFPWQTYEVRARIAAINLEDGRTNWQYPPDGPSYSMKDISVNHENISFSWFKSEEFINRVFILDTRTGEAIKEYPYQVLDMLSTPKFFLFRDESRFTHGISLATDQEVLTIPITTFGRQFAYDGKNIYSLNAGQLTGYDADRLEKVYSGAQIQDNEVSTSVASYLIVDGKALVLFGNQRLGLYELEPELQERWHLSSERFSSGLWPPIVLDGKIYIALENGGVRQVDLLSEAIQAVGEGTAQLTAVSAPALFQNRIVWFFSDGTLRSYDPQAMEYRIEIESATIRYPESDSPYYDPKIGVNNDTMVVYWGCKNVYAFSRKIE